MIITDDIKILYNNVCNLRSVVVFWWVSPGAHCKVGTSFVKLDLYFASPPPEFEIPPKNQICQGDGALLRIFWRNIHSLPHFNQRLSLINVIGTHIIWFLETPKWLHFMGYWTRGSVYRQAVLKLKIHQLSKLTKIW